MESPRDTFIPLSPPPLSYRSSSSTPPPISRRPRIRFAHQRRHIIRARNTSPEDSDDPTTSEIPDNNTPSFHLFPKLPAEVRAMIWDMTLPGPRVWVGEVESRRRLAQIKVCRHKGLPSYDYPATLAVCRESREVAKRAGGLSFSMSAVKSNRGIWFDSDRDVMFFECSSLRNLMVGYKPRKSLHYNVVKNIAIDAMFLEDLTVVDDDESFERGCSFALLQRLFAYFPNVETIHAVYRNKPYASLPLIIDLDPVLWPVAGDDVVPSYSPSRAADENIEFDGGVYNLFKSFPQCIKRCSTNAQVGWVDWDVVKKTIEEKVNEDEDFFACRKSTNPIKIIGSQLGFHDEDGMPRWYLN